MFFRKIFVINDQDSGKSSRQVWNFMQAFTQLHHVIGKINA